jgi:DNA-binding MltR family transcriptional regulator
MNRKSMKEIEPETEELSKFLNVLNLENDRGLALVAAAMIDERLKDILQSFMADIEESNLLINGFNAPLGTLYSRTIACYSLGLIQKNEFEEITIIRKIRNDFGHEWTSTCFDDQSVIDRCSNLSWRGPKEYEESADAKSRFRTCVSMLLVDLMGRSRLVNKERRKDKHWPNKTR